MEIRRTTLVALALTVACGAVHAQVTPPALINYEGVQRDQTTGLPITGTVDMAFTFYPDPNSTGTDILKDAHAGVAVSSGDFSVALGGGAVTDGASAGPYTSLIDLFRDFNAVWMEIQIGNPVVETLSPRVRLLGSPYAMTTANSVNAANLAGRPATGYLDRSSSSQIKSGGLVVPLMSVPGAVNASGGLTAPSVIISGQVSANGGVVLPDGTVNMSRRSPMQIATLHWDTVASQNVMWVGGFLAALAFDGASIWVGDSFSNDVTKLRAADGANLGAFPLGINPWAIAFDGSSMWVLSKNQNSVTKLRASDGANLGTFAVGPDPTGVAFDGSSIWVTNNGGGTVTRLRASDGANLGTFATGSAPFAVAFDGSSIWVGNNASGNVTKLRASDGINQGTFAVGVNPLALAFDGSSIWVANAGDNTITKLRASDGASLGTFAVGTQPNDVKFDGSSIWVTNYLSNDVTKLRASDGANLGTFAAGPRPLHLVFDGSSIWVANQTGGTLRKL